MSDAFNHARSLAVTLLNLQPKRTPEVIQAQVALAVQTTRAAGMGDVDADALVAQRVFANIARHGLYEVESAHGKHE